MTKSEKFVPQRISRPNKKEKKEENEFLSWTYSLLIAVAIALVLRLFIFDFVVVKGSSMEPTLSTGQVVFVEKVSYRFKDPEKSDIVISKYSEDKTKYVKRVIANAGDEIRITESELFVNDNQLIEPYILEKMNNDMKPFTVDTDSVFLMGDNRNNSLDSRVVGSIDHNIVKGKALIVVWPFSKFGRIENR